MTIVSTFLQALKDAGVYDNSAIILMADHGYGYDRDIELLGRLNPLLAVKGIDEHHSFRISKSPICYEDLQICYQRLINGSESEASFDAKEGDVRRRRVLIHAYEQDDHMEEYVQTAGAFHFDALVPTGKVYEQPGVAGKRHSIEELSTGDSITKE